MNEVTLHTMAHLRLDRAHLRPSLRQGGRRLLATPAFGKAAKEHTSSDPLGFARPFIPSSPRPPDTRLRAERIGGSTSRTTGWAAETTHSLTDLSDQARISDVIQDSDFRTEIRLAEKAPLFFRRPSVRQAGTPGVFTTSHISTSRRSKT
jgi:hypothetical protein